MLFTSEKHMDTIIILNTSTRTEGLSKAALEQYHNNHNFSRFLHKTSHSKREKLFECTGFQIKKS